MQVAHEFKSPWKKFDRAQFHIANLEAEVLQFVAGIRTKRIIEPVTPDHGSVYDIWLDIYRMHCREAGRPPKDPPDEPAFVHKVHLLLPDTDSLDVIAGDAIQNLRQSLDHAACACARSIGKTDKGTHFPLVESPDQLEKRIRDQASKLPPSIKDLIRKVEPGGGLLFALHSLGGGDKHRITCSFTHQGSAIPKVMHASKGGWLSAGLRAAEWDPVNNDIRYALTGSADEVDYDFMFGAGINLSADASIFAEKPAVAALKEIANTVRGVIREMETEMTRIVTPP